MVNTNTINNVEAIIEAVIQGYTALKEAGVIDEAEKIASGAGKGIIALFHSGNPQAQQVVDNIHAASAQLPATPVTTDGK